MTWMLRLAIARVRLKQPRWVFADETTSARISIAHRPGVAAFHTRQWTLEKRPPGEETVHPIRAHDLSQAAAG